MDELDAKVGNKDVVKLVAGSVIVKQVVVETKEKNNKKFKLVSLHVLYPDRIELVKLTNIMIMKVQGNNRTIAKDGIWYRLDEDQNLDKNCNAALLVRTYGKESLKQLENTSINTELDTQGYLCVKAY